MNYNYTPNKITKQNLIDIIQSLPDTILIDITHSVPKPDDTEYLMRTNIIHTAISKCRMDISIEFRESN